MLQARFGTKLALALGLLVVVALGVLSRWP
jgi:hypothetical protein